MTKEGGKRLAQKSSSELESKLCGIMTTGPRKMAKRAETLSVNQTSHLQKDVIMEKTETHRANGYPRERALGTNTGALNPTSDSSHDLVTHSQFDTSRQTNPRLIPQNASNHFDGERLDCDQQLLIKQAKDSSEVLEQFNNPVSKFIPPSTSHNNNISSDQQVCYNFRDQQQNSATDIQTLGALDSAQIRDRQFVDPNQNNNEQNHHHEQMITREESWIQSQNRVALQRMRKLSIWLLRHKVTHSATMRSLLCRHIAEKAANSLQTSTTSQNGLAQQQNSSKSKKEESRGGAAGSKKAKKDTDTVSQTTISANVNQVTKGGKKSSKTKKSDAQKTTSEDKSVKGAEKTKSKRQAREKKGDGGSKAAKQALTALTTPQNNNAMTTCLEANSQLALSDKEEQMSGLEQVEAQGGNSDEQSVMQENQETSLKEPSFDQQSLASKASQKRQKSTTGKKSARGKKQAQQSGGPNPNYQQSGKDHEDSVAYNDDASYGLQVAGGAIGEQGLGKYRRSAKKVPAKEKNGPNPRQASKNVMDSDSKSNKIVEKEIADIERNLNDKEDGLSERGGAEEVEANPTLYQAVLAGIKKACDNQFCPYNAKVKARRLSSVDQQACSKSPTAALVAAVGEQQSRHQKSQQGAGKIPKHAANLGGSLSFKAQLAARLSATTCAVDQEQEEADPVFYKVKLKYERAGTTGSPSSTLSLCQYCHDLCLANQKCDYCFQVYFSGEDDAEMDGKSWILCSKCEKWNHTDCEIQHGTDAAYRKVAQEEQIAEMQEIEQKQHLLAGKKKTNEEPKDQQNESPAKMSGSQEATESEYHCLKCRKDQKSIKQTTSGTTQISTTTHTAAPYKNNQSGSNHNLNHCVGSGSKKGSKKGSQQPKLPVSAFSSSATKDQKTSQATTTASATGIGVTNNTTTTANSNTPSTSRRGGNSGGQNQYTKAKRIAAEQAAKEAALLAEQEKRETLKTADREAQIEKKEAEFALKKASPKSSDKNVDPSKDDPPAHNRSPQSSAVQLPVTSSEQIPNTSAAPTESKPVEEETFSPKREAKSKDSMVENQAAKILDPEDEEIAKNNSPEKLDPNRLSKLTTNNSDKQSSSLIACGDSSSEVVKGEPEKQKSGGSKPVDPQLNQS